MKQTGELQVPDPAAERVADYTRAQRKRGLVRATVWVPKGQLNELKKMAAQMRKNAGMLLPSEKTSPGCVVPHGKPIVDESDESE